MFLQLVLILVVCQDDDTSSSSSYSVGVSCVCVGGAALQSGRLGFILCEEWPFFSLLHMVFWFYIDFKLNKIQFQDHLCPILSFGDHLYRLKT